MGGGPVAFVVSMGLQCGAVSCGWGCGQHSGPTGR